MEEKMSRDRLISAVTRVSAIENGWMDCATNCCCLLCVCVCTEATKGTEEMFWRLKAQKQSNGHTQKLFQADPKMP